MTETRAFDLGDILAITHGYPIMLTPYLEILAFLNDRPATVVDSRQAPAAWIFTLHPRLREIEASCPRSDNGLFTDEQLTVWDAWAEEIKARIGATLPLRPIPHERRDQRSMLELALDKGADPSKIWNIDPNRPDLGLNSPDETD